MKEVPLVEPPSWLRPGGFMIGQDSHGNWVVQDQSGRRGGLFVSCAAAFRYIRSENGNRPKPVAMINGIFELDISQPTSAAENRRIGGDTHHPRRAA